MRFLSTYLRPLSPWERFRDDLLGSPLRRMLGEPCFEGEGGGGEGGGNVDPVEGDDAPEIGADGKPIPVPPYVAKLRKEAAGRRIELRKTEAGLKTANAGLTKANETVATLQTQIAELKALVEGKTVSPADKPKPGSPEALIADLQEKLDKAEKRVETIEKAGSQSTEKARAKTLSTAVRDIVTGLKLNAPDSAAKLLEGLAKLTDDDKVVFVVRDAETGEESEVPATAEAVGKHSLLDKVFFPTKGVSGAGSRSGNEPPVPVGLDLARIKDPVYYKAHYQEFLAYMRSREPGRQ